MAIARFAHILPISCNFSDLLERVRCFCLFATHFHEMADLTEKDGACAKQVLLFETLYSLAFQMTVTIEEGQLSMLYEVRPGVATSSFGLEVAKIVGFPEKVVTVSLTCCFNLVPLGSR